METAYGFTDVFIIREGVGRCDVVEGEEGRTYG